MTDPCYATVTSITSTVILPKISVGCCMHAVAVNVIQPVAPITRYCSVSPADFTCAVSTGWGWDEGWGWGEEGHEFR